MPQQAFLQKKDNRIQRKLELGFPEGIVLSRIVFGEIVGRLDKLQRETIGAFEVAKFVPQVQQSLPGQVNAVVVPVSAYFTGDVVFHGRAIFVAEWQRYIFVGLGVSGKESSGCY